MNKQLVINNVVNKYSLRKVQIKVLEELSGILKKSFGPNGSNTCIKKENALPIYTKDGHTIVSNIQYNGIIEQSIKDDIESITRYIVKTVGDGTTSAVILSNEIFYNILNFVDNYKPIEVINTLNKISSEIKDNILKSAHEFTDSDAYDIAMISTNGNKFISDMLKNIYEEFGQSVFIDVSPSISNDTVIKSYNGMTLNAGYSDSCYVTNAKNNTSEIDNPEVYFFEHPIDTREMGVYLDSIISKNIITPVNTKNFDNITPTVIFAPKISQDMSSIMDTLTTTMTGMPVNNRLPICIISEYHEPEQLMDLARMCGAKMIHKYIDPKIYEEDLKHGAAPTPETIGNWAGGCERVVAYADKTTFIKPSEMYNEDGSYSEIYNNIVNYLETEISRCVRDGEGIRDVAKLKRRLHSLKSNMVEIFIGGITQADRDSLRDLVEDAVLNIRSAALNGVGLGANMTAMISIHKDDINNINTDLDEDVYNSIYNAYEKLFYALYDKDTYGIDIQDAISEANEGRVFNLRTNKYDNTVKSSIMSDIIILDTVCKIIGIMVTCNQFLVPSALHNIYD